MRIRRNADPDALPDFAGFVVAAASLRRLGAYDDVRSRDSGLQSQGSSRGSILVNSGEHFPMGDRFEANTRRVWNEAIRCRRRDGISIDQSRRARGHDRAIGGSNLRRARRSIPSSSRKYEQRTFLAIAEAQRLEFGEDLAGSRTRALFPVENSTARRVSKGPRKQLTASCWNAWLVVAGILALGITALCFRLQVTVH